MSASRETTTPTEFHFPEPCAAGGHGHVWCAVCMDGWPCVYAPPTGAIVTERQRCICDGICLDRCRACNHSGRDLEECCIADPQWEPDDDDLARRGHP